MKSALPLQEMAVCVIEPGARSRKDKISCRIGKHINFDLEALASFSSHKWQPLVYDTLIVAAVVEFCDRALARSALNWGRRFVVHVPVHNPEKWSEHVVKGALLEALNLLTGDDWNFEFHARKTPAEPPIQEHMTFPSNAEAVIAYSDGMDSRAVAGLESRRLGKRLVRVRVGNKQRDISKKERLELPFTALPYAVKLEGGVNAETSARSRGFKFAVVSAMAAYLVDAPAIIVPESGQGALAPAMLPVGHGYEDYRNHPAFTKLMARFVYALLGYRPHYQFPRLWMTKGQTLREFVETCSNAKQWATTRSCWQQSRQVAVLGARRQCGICAACMLRRLSVHAAGLHEPPESYVWESLSASTWEAGAAKEFGRHTQALREYAIAGVLHFEHFSLIRESTQYELIKRLRTNELARALEETPQAVAQNLDRLLQQHAMEWSAFTNDLGHGSFVRKWIDHSS